MGREIKRVAIDFDHELHKVWPGYVDYIDHCNCEKYVADKDFPDECMIARRDCPYYYEPPVGEGWQVWETVSEGSPVTPVFVTREELIVHLVTVGSDENVGPVSRAAAERFVDDGWAPSMVGLCISGQNVLMSGVAAAEYQSTKEDE